MEYRQFGQTGMQVSAIGLGCWEIGGGYGQIEEEQFIQAVHRALDLGINCFSFIVCNPELPGTSIPSLDLAGQSLRSH